MGFQPTTPCLQSRFRRLALGSALSWSETLPLVTRARFSNDHSRRLSSFGIFSRPLAACPRPGVSGRDGRAIRVSPLPTPPGRNVAVAIPTGDIRDPWVAVSCLSVPLGRWRVRTHEGTRYSGSLPQVRAFARLGWGLAACGNAPGRQVRVADAARGPRAARAQL
jgi:hypothetical protein